MIAEIATGRVGTVIVKDMSRLGRDYLKVGCYTEIAFSDADVRFIAINNGVDSNNQQDSDFTPFLNIINEWYAKDRAKKSELFLRQKVNLESLSALLLHMATRRILRIRIIGLSMNLQQRL